MYKEFLKKNSRGRYVCRISMHRKYLLLSCIMCLCFRLSPQKGKVLYIYTSTSIYHLIIDPSRATFSPTKSIYVKCLIKGYHIFSFALHLWCIFYIFRCINPLSWHWDRIPNTYTIKEGNFILLIISEGSVHAQLATRKKGNGWRTEWRKQVDPERCILQNHTPVTYLFQHLTIHSSTD